jgi:hypothetical protein
MARGSDRPRLETRGVSSPAPRKRAATGPPGAAAASGPAGTARTRAPRGYRRRRLIALYWSITSAAAVMRSRTALGHRASHASAVHTRIVLGA